MLSLSISVFPMSGSGCPLPCLLNRPALPSMLPLLSTLTGPPWEAPKRTLRGLVASVAVQLPVRSQFESSARCSSRGVQSSSAWS